MAAMTLPSTASVTSSCTVSGFATVVFVKTTVLACCAADLPPDRTAARRGSRSSSRAAVPTPAPASHSRRVRSPGLRELCDVGAGFSFAGMGMVFTGVY